MIKKFAKGSIFCFSNSAFYFMRAELNGIPCAVRLYDGEVMYEVDLVRNGYVNPKGQYKDLDALYFEEECAQSEI